MIKDIKNILIIRLAGLGDMLLTLSAISPLKRLYPKANIYFLTDKQNLSFLKCFDFVTDTIEYKRGTKNVLYIIQRLKTLNIDVTINFERALKKTLLAFMSGSKERIGYDIFPNNLFNTYKAPDYKDNPTVPMRQRYFELVKFLGAKCYDITLNFTPSSSALERVQDFLLANEINPSKDFVVGINPVTGFKSKYWTGDQWAKVADFIINKYGAKVIFTYGPTKDQRDTCLDILQRMKEKAILSFQTNLVEFGALLKNFDLFLCLDSGPFHFAVSLNVPTISLWGRGNTKQWGVESPLHLLINKNVECSPCDKFACESMLCMKLISAEDVIEKIIALYPQIRKN